MDYTYYATSAQPYNFNTFSPAPGQQFDSQDDSMVDAQDVFPDADGFPTYDPAFQFAGAGFLPSSQPTGPPAGISPQRDTPPNTFHPTSTTLLPSSERASVGVPTLPTTGEHDIADAQNGSRSDSDEKDSMNPQQSRRKAQNRAAQRAFRERKEKHVKELETKLNDLSEHSSSLLSDNERLKRELQRLATQNEILRATAAKPQPPPRSPSPTHGPQTYSPTAFATAVGLDAGRLPIKYEFYHRPSGQKMLHAGAAWDFIVRHELVRRGAVDLGDVATKLRGRAVCDGYGPSFIEADVVQVIEESAHTGHDELI